MAKNSPSLPPQRQNKSLLSSGIMSQSPEMDAILAMMEKLLHWAAIIDSSDDAIISKSIEGYITSWNRGAQRLYGYTPEEIIGQPVAKLMPPERADDFPFIMGQLQAGKKVEHYETKRMTKDGKVIDVSITVSPIRDSHGTIIGASKIARDITERVENERRKDDFISIASHELKTPITSQKIYGELLENLILKNGDTHYLSYIQKINKQTNKLVKLINDLLELSKVRSGRLLMEYEDFELNLLLSDIVDDMQKTTKHPIRFTPVGEIHVHGDRERLGQVFTNLLSNAIKYSPDKSEILVTAYQKDGNLIAAIQDFGIGIAKEYHEKIFERFFRVDGKNEKTYPGMGIGLDFSREIVVRHSGRIWVESQKGKGSTFYFSVPLHAPHTE